MTVASTAQIGAVCLAPLLDAYFRQSFAGPFGFFVKALRFQPADQFAHVGGGHGAQAFEAAGDFLLSMNGVPLYSVLDFQEQLYLAGIGRELTLRLYKDGQEREVKLTSVDRPKAAKPR